MVFFRDIVTVAQIVQPLLLHYSAQDVGTFGLLVHPVGHVATYLADQLLVVLLIDLALGLGDQ